MIIHDWKRVPRETWHSFHISWVAAIQSVLNNGVLPPGFYSQAEPMAEGFAQPRRIVIRDEQGDRIVSLIEFAYPRDNERASLHTKCLLLWVDVFRSINQFELIDMPLFLTPERYVNVPLEETYTSAFRGVPQRWRTVLDA